MAPAGGASCTSNPQFWGAIAGPNTAKQSGDAFMTRTCSSGNSGCTGTVNNEFNPLGYFYIVRVGPAAVGLPMTIQIYDPAFVEVGDQCEKGPSGTPLTNTMNPFVPHDAAARYAGGNASPFCNGDVLGGGNAADIVTSYGLRLPTDTYQPKLATPVLSCEKQYPGWASTTTTAAQLTAIEHVGVQARRGPGLPAVGGPVHVHPDAVGRPLPADPDQRGPRRDLRRPGRLPEQLRASSARPATTPPCSGTATTASRIRVKGTARASISVAGFQSMGMYANYSNGSSGANSTFNLVRVVPAAATKTLKIGFFDTGDATQPGTLTVQPPPDSNLPASISNCTGSGVVTGSVPGCQLTNVSSSTYNGKWQYVNVPIPANYTCTVAQAGGCWFTVRFNFPSGVPTDTTTWTAKIDGDPVRLIQ